MEKIKTVGVIGYGFIGNATVELFRSVGPVFVYDKAGYDGKTRYENVTLCPTVDQVVLNSEVIFVAVPTPMEPDGRCHTGIVESVIQDIQNSAVKNGAALDSFVVVLKSTVPPGFTRSMQDRYALRIVFSPEFLTEANAVEDFRRTNRVIIGGDVEDCRVVARFFELVWSDRLIWDDRSINHPDGPVSIIACDFEHAELVKLSTNIHLTARVMISNEIYLICKKMGIDYDVVKTLTQLDRRIGTSHMNVPGPDGDLGYGGHCFVKDTRNLAYIAEHVLGTACPEESLFRSLDLRNNEIRTNRDWEKQKGRAVV